MTNKFDQRRPDRPPTSAPAPATEPPTHDTKVENGVNTGDGALKETLSTGATTSDSSANGAGPRKRRTKGNSEMPSKDSNVELQTRHNVIGAGLKRIFDEIVEEPIPSEFLELLDKIDLKREQ
jgi:hypothetical protein